MNVNSRIARANFTGYASGAIASFTGLRQAPTKVKVNATGVTECNVCHCSQNILNPNSPVYGNYTINPDGSYNESPDRLATGLIPCQANTLYTAITDRRITDNYYSFIDVAYYDTNKSFISRNTATSLASPTFTFTTPATAKYLVYSEQFNYVANVTPTAYETYHRCLVEGSASEYISFIGNTYNITVDQIVTQIEQFIGANNIFVYDENVDDGTVEVFFVTI